jgi:putative ATPase
VKQQNLPDSLKGKSYYSPSDQGLERQIAERLESLKKEAGTEEG